MPIKIDFISNVRDLLRGTQNVEEAFDDVADSLDDVVRDADKSVEKLERSFENLGDEVDDAGRDSEQSLGRLERSFRDLANASKDTGRDIGRNLDDGFDKASKGAEEFKGEASSTAREAAASFSEPADALDAVQELAANAFAGFGPVGAGVGLAAALGLGTVTAELTKQQEEAKKLKGYFTEAYQTAAEEGRDFIDSMSVLREANDIQFNPDRVGEYNRAVQVAEKLNIDVNDVLLARAGDQESLNVVIEATEQAYDDVKAAAEEQGSTAIRLSLREIHELDNIAREYEGIGELHDENAQKARNSQNIKDTLSTRERDQIKRTRDADQSRYEALAKHIRNIPDTKTVTIKYDTDESAIYAAQRRAEAWARRGLSVAVTGTLTGKGVWQ